MKKAIAIIVLGLLLSGCVVSDTQMKQTTTETGIKLESKIKEINKRILTPLNTHLPMTCKKLMVSVQFHQLRGEAQTYCQFRGPISL